MACNVGTTMLQSEDGEEAWGKIINLSVSHCEHRRNTIIVIARESEMMRTSSNDPGDTFRVSSCDLPRTPDIRGPWLVFRERAVTVRTGADSYPGLSQSEASVRGAQPIAAEIIVIALLSSDQPQL